jgi:hypothetical protein
MNVLRLRRACGRHGIRRALSGRNARFPKMATGVPACQVNRGSRGKRLRQNGTRRQFLVARRGRWSCGGAKIGNKRRFRRIAFARRHLPLIRPPGSCGVGRKKAFALRSRRGRYALRS